MENPKENDSSILVFKRLVHLKSIQKYTNRYLERDRVDVDRKDANVCIDISSKYLVSFLTFVFHTSSKPKWSLILSI